ncbi:5-histidylcysteine sulfoxide synthase/putative 4-mercaptohistidine N1-methyltransferase OS=Castellaniella defragrans OX=75697 GN=HNR28_000661 PE=4 SV=1 [Castellaniella defragrans]
MSSCATPASAASQVAAEERFPRTPNLADPDTDRLRTTLRQYFLATFDRYESLFQCLANDEAYVVKPIALRHPLIFYFGHTATFFVNKLLLTRMIDQRLDHRMESIFAVGVDEMSWDNLNDAHYEWPTVAEVLAYRNRVRALVCDLIDHAPLQSPIDWQNPWWAIIMGIEHERIHLETSSVLIRQHALKYVRPVDAWAPRTDTHAEAPENLPVRVAAGAVRVGKEFSDPQYGWDNEYGRHTAKVESFLASKYLVSNQEFLAFVEAGGYRNHHNWTEEGRQWLEFSQAAHPTFWVKKTKGWFLRLMTQEIPMPWAWPVEVNYLEAKAFCNWKASETGEPVRLPTEDEWYRLYDAAGLKDPSDAPCAANLHLDHGASSCPVDTYAHGEWFDVVGNVWQWTETPTYPFDGFDVHPIYDDFTTPTFDGRHNLIKGGSWIACGNEAVRASRYAFRRHFFQHAGFRYVISHAPAEAPAAYYETDKLMSEYAEFHYGDTYFGVPNFPQALAKIAIETLGKRPHRRALDLGCASGRATFELARAFEHVTGVDFSARFINQGVQLIQTGQLRYTLTDEGDLVSYKARTLADLQLQDTVARVEFFQGDACNLKPQYTGYNLVLAANLIDRLYDPARFLDQIHERIVPGGLLMIASPYTWLEEHTPHDAWVGGFKKDAENYTTLDGLKDHLSAHFRLVAGPTDVPFVIRETRHKFQHTLSELTIWERLE